MNIPNAKEANIKTANNTLNQVNVNKLREWYTTSIENSIDSAIESGKYTCKIIVSGDDWTNYDINDDIAIDVLHEFEKELDNLGYNTLPKFRGTIREKRPDGNVYPWEAVLEINWDTIIDPKYRDYDEDNATEKLVSSINNEIGSNVGTIIKKKITNTQTRYELANLLTLKELKATISTYIRSYLLRKSKLGNILLNKVINGIINSTPNDEGYRNVMFTYTHHRNTLISNANDEYELFIVKNVSILNAAIDSVRNSVESYCDIDLEFIIPDGTQDMHSCTILFNWVFKVKEV